MVLSAPVALVSGALRQVIMHRASELLHRREPMAPLLRDATLGLLGLGAIPTALAFAFAPWLFEQFLGRSWVEAGRHAQPILLWQLTVLINAPTAAIFPILRSNRLILQWQVATLAVAGAAVGLGATVGAVRIVDAFCATMSAANVAILLLVYRAAMEADRTLLIDRRGGEASPDAPSPPPPSDGPPPPA
jgi:O-antigen/teichoic acid export membrane protein